MIQFFETIKVLQGSYSGVFVLFWGLLSVVCVGMWMLEPYNQKISVKLERALFWIFGLAMAGFAAFRPIGIARDDLAYLDIYNTICPSLNCGQWIQGSRDWGWYSLVGMLKSWSINSSTMLWLSAVGLLIKLRVIYSLVRRPLAVLLFYLSLFYQVQDLTAWRASMACTFFMLSIWLIIRSRSYCNSWLLFTCGFFHKQAFVAPLILVGRLLKKNYTLLTVACLTPVILLIFGVYPEFEEIIQGTGIDQRIAIDAGLMPYFVAKEAGVYRGWLNAPIVVYPQIFLILWLLLKEYFLNEKLESLMAGCLVMGCLFLWGFASWPDAQVRFFEFFLLPTILLVGMRRLNALELAGLFAVSGAFVIKYNVLHHMLV